MSVKKTSEKKMPEKKIPEKKKTRWRCTICGWETSEPSTDPPAECPVCGAGPEDFERIEE